jgi:hypothetical protein
MSIALRMKPLVIALMTLGTVPAATAAVVDFMPSTGNSSLFFFAYDTAGRSYLKGLSIRMDDLVANPSLSQSFTLPGLFTQFQGSTTDPVWGVAAADTLSSGSFKEYRILTTSATSFTRASFPTTNSGTKNAAGNGATGYLNAADDGARVPGVAILTTLTNDPAYAGQSGWNSTFGATLGASSTVAMVTAAAGPTDNLAAMWLLNTGTSTSGIGKPTITLLGQFKLTVTAASSTLTLNNPTPIPVPAAVWMLGSALVALTGVARRRT